MPGWLSGALQIAGSALEIGLKWVTGYQEKDVSESRQEIDDQKQIDKFNIEQSQKDLGGVRLDLSDDAPGR